MNSEPLSLSSPRRGTGNRPRISCRAALTRLCPFPQIGCSSTQPVAISTAHRVCKKNPLLSAPQWATRSISRKPGWASFQSAKVRRGICCLSQLPGCVVLRPRRGTVRRAGARTRSRVAVLIARRWRAVVGATVSSPQATRRSSRAGRNGWSRLAPIWPAASHSTCATRDIASVPPGSPDRAPARARPGCGAQTSQHGLAVIARRGHDLRHQATALAPAEPLIALALLAQVLAHTRPRHGYPLGGNRTSATQPSRPVTIILRRCGSLTSLPLSVRFLRALSSESVNGMSNYAAVSLEHAANSAIRLGLKGSALWYEIPALASAAIL